MLLVFQQTCCLHVAKHLWTWKSDPLDLIGLVPPLSVKGLPPQLCQCTRSIMSVILWHSLIYTWGLIYLLASKFVTVPFVRGVPLPHPFSFTSGALLPHSETKAQTSFPFALSMPHLRARDLEQLCFWGVPALSSVLALKQHHFEHLKRRWGVFPICSHFRGRGSAVLPAQLWGDTPLALWRAGATRPRIGLLYSTSAYGGSFLSGWRISVWRVMNFRMKALWVALL